MLNFLQRFPCLCFLIFQDDDMDSMYFSLSSLACFPGCRIIFVVINFTWLMSHLSNSFESSIVCYIASNVTCSGIGPPNQTTVAVLVYCFNFLLNLLHAYKEDKWGCGPLIKMWSIDYEQFESAVLCLKHTNLFVLFQCIYHWLFFFERGLVRSSLLTRRSIFSTFGC